MLTQVKGKGVREPSLPSRLGSNSSDHLPCLPLALTHQGAGSEDIPSLAVGQRVCVELVTLAQGLLAVGLPGPLETVGY